MERFARSAVDQLSQETLAELQAAAGPPAAAAASPAATPAAVEAAAPSEVGEDQSEGGSEPEAAGGADHFDLLAALADVAGGELGPTPQRPAPPAAQDAAQATVASAYAGQQPGGAGKPAAAADSGATDPALDSPFADQQHAQPPHAPAQQHGATFLRQPSTASAAGQRPGSPGGGPPLPASPGGGLSGAGSGGAALAARVEAATQRKVAQALAAFEEADLSSAESMLRPLRLLAVANKGGQLLRVRGGAGGGGGPGGGGTPGFNSRDVGSGLHPPGATRSPAARLHGGLMLAAECCCGLAAGLALSPSLPCRPPLAGHCALLALLLDQPAAGDV